MVKTLMQQNTFIMLIAYCDKALRQVVLKLVMGGMGD